MYQELPLFERAYVPPMQLSPPVGDGRTESPAALAEELQRANPHARVRVVAGPREAYLRYSLDVAKATEDARNRGWLPPVRLDPKLHPVARALGIDENTAVHVLDLDPIGLALEDRYLPRGTGLVKVTFDDDVVIEVDVDQPHELNFPGGLDRFGRIRVNEYSAEAPLASEGATPRTQRLISPATDARDHLIGFQPVTEDELKAHAEMVVERGLDEGVWTYRELTSAEDIRSMARRILDGEVSFPESSIDFQGNARSWLSPAEDLSFDAWSLAHKVLELPSDIAKLHIRAGILGALGVLDPDHYTGPVKEAEFDAAVKSVAKAVSEVNVHSRTQAERILRALPAPTQEKVLNEIRISDDPGREAILERMGRALEEPDEQAMPEPDDDDPESSP